MLSDGNITLAGSATVRIVGIGTLPDEVLPDGLGPRARILVSPDVTRRFTCPLVEVPAGPSLQQIVDTVLPKGCRTIVPVLLAPAPGRQRRGPSCRGRVHDGRPSSTGTSPRRRGGPGTTSIATTTEQDRAQVGAVRATDDLGAHRARGRGGRTHTGA